MLPSVNTPSTSKRMILMSPGPVFRGNVHIGILPMRLGIADKRRHRKGIHKGEQKTEVPALEYVNVLYGRLPLPTTLVRSFPS